MDFLIKILDLRAGKKVVDLGAGTGKFTKSLLRADLDITTVEPVENMRKKISDAFPGILVLDGSAESIPLKDNAVDAVFSAQAFHWFKGHDALCEINRVLSPEGKLGLVWNVRDESVPWMAEITGIIDPYEDDAPRYKTMDWKKAFQDTNFFLPLNFRSFTYFQSGDVDTVVNRVGSISFISSLDDRNKELILRKIREMLVSKYKIDPRKKINIPYLTHVYWCGRRK